MRNHSVNPAHPVKKRTIGSFIYEQVLTSFAGEREQFGYILAETDVASVVDKRFERQCATLVNLLLGGFAAVLPVSETANQCVDSGPARVIGCIGQKCTEKRQHFERHVIVRPSDDPANGRIVDLLVFATAKLCDDEVDRRLVLVVQFVDFDVQRFAVRQSRPANIDLSVCVWAVVSVLSLADIRTTSRLLRFRPQSMTAKFSAGSFRKTRIGSVVSHSMIAKSLC